VASKKHTNNAKKRLQMGNDNVNICYSGNTSLFLISTTTAVLHIHQYQSEFLVHN